MIAHEADFNEDGCIDVADFSILARIWMLSEGEGGYDDTCDLQDNNKIDMADMQLLLENWLDGCLYSH